MFNIQNIINVSTLGCFTAQQIINAIINIPLSTSIGDSVFSRASTGTLTDFEGLVKTAKVGETRFQGVRRVENLFRYSEDFNNNTWNYYSSITNLGNNIIRFDGNGGRIRQSINIQNGNTTTFQIKARVISGNATSIRVLGIGSAGNEPLLELTNEWKILSHTGIVGSNYIGLVSRDDNISEIEIEYMQLEYVTGQANQTPSEYISNDSFNKTTGSELVINGTFDTDTDWTKGSGWSIENGKANQAGGNNYSGLIQYGILTVGRKVIVSYTVTNTTSGGVRPKLGGQYLGDYYGNGEYKYIGTTTANENLSFVCNSDFDGSIDNVSVKEVQYEANVDGVKYFDYENGNTFAISDNIVVNGTFDTDTDWNKGDGWSIENGKAVRQSVGSNSNIVQNINAGETINYSITVSNYVSGEFRLYVGGHLVERLTASGSHSGTYSSTSNITQIYIRGYSDAVGSIDNVVIKKMTNEVVEGKGQDITTGQGVLIEKQSTNIELYSEDFTNDYWNKSDSQILDSNILAPNGTMSKLLDVTTADSQARIERSFSLSSETRTFSCYMRAGTQHYGVLNHYSLDEKVIVDLNTGQITYNNNGTGKVENVGNGWYRVSITFGDTSSLTDNIPGIGVCDNSTNINNSSVGDNIHIWGPQYEKGTIATSYIQTNTTTVTRVEDNLSYTNNKFPHNDIVIVMTITPEIDFSNLNTNYIRLFSTYDSRGDSNQLRTFGDTEYGIVSTSGLAFGIKQSDFVKDVETKVAFSLKKNGADVEASIFKDGVKVYSTTVADTTLDHSNLNKMTIGSYNSDASIANFKDVKVFKNRTDAQIISLTTL